jgi:hypothetical protein
MRKLSSEELKKHQAMMGAIRKSNKYVETHKKHHSKNENMKKYRGMGDNKNLIEHMESEKHADAERKKLVDFAHQIPLAEAKATAAKQHKNFDFYRTTSLKPELNMNPENRSLHDRNEMSKTERLLRKQDYSRDIVEQHEGDDGLVEIHDFLTGKKEKFLPQDVRLKKHGENQITLVAKSREGSHDNYRIIGNKSPNGINLAEHHKALLSDKHGMGHNPEHSLSTRHEGKFNLMDHKKDDAQKHHNFKDYEKGNEYVYQKNPEKNN